MTITKIMHSATPGNQPSALASGQIAINEADAALYYRDPVTGLPSSLLDLGAAFAAYANLALNGAMEIDQVRNGALQSAVANAAYVIDMAKYGATGAQVVSAQQVPDAPPGLVKSLKIAVTTANVSPAASDVCSIQFPIEGRNIARLGFGAAGASGMTIGFYVKAFRAGAYAICVTNSAGNRSYSTSFTVAAVATWQWVSVAVPGDITGTWAADNTTGMLVSIVMMAGSSLLPVGNAWVAAGVQGVAGMTNGCATISDFMQITGVSFFPGHVTTTATRGLIAHRSFADSLAACSRYWQKSYDYETVTGTVTALGAAGVIQTFPSAATYVAGISVRLPVSMRADPTVTIYSTVTGAAGFIRDVTDNFDMAVSVTAIGQKGFVAQGTMGGSSSTENYQFHWATDARL